MTDREKLFIVNYRCSCGPVHIEVWCDWRNSVIRCPWCAARLEPRGHVVRQTELQRRALEEHEASG